MQVGAHMSIGGGVSNAPRSGTEDFDCEVIQIFTRNPRGYSVDPLEDEEIQAWNDEMADRDLGPTLVHAMYLINLAEPDEEKWDRSVDQLRIELERADALDIPWVVFHPGSHKSSSREEAIERVARGIDEALERAGDVDAIPLVEGMPGAGTQVGRSFEEIATILDHADHDDRVGVCLDTCHTFVAGYPIHEGKGYEETIQRFDDLVGLDKLQAWHLNDAENPFESEKDGHAPLGEGRIGEGCFERLVNDDRFASVPGYVETSEDIYEQDLETLYRLREG
jgi:deoxyribonuclease-4